MCMLNSAICVIKYIQLACAPGARRVRARRTPLMQHAHCTLQGWRSQALLVSQEMEVCSFAYQAKISS